MSCPEPAYWSGIRKNVAHASVYVLVLLVFSGISGCRSLHRQPGQSSDLCRQHIEESFAAQQTGDLLQARKHLQQAAEVQPRYPETWWNLAELSIQQDNYTAAAEELKHYIELQPNDPQGYLRLSQLYYLQNQYTQSEEMLKEAIRRSPNNFDAVILAARLSRKQADHQQAIANYYRALQIRPNHVAATLELAELLIARQESARASSMLRELSRKTLNHEDLARTHLNLGIAYGQEERWESAVKHLESSRALSEEISSRDLYRLAYAHWKAGASQQALKLLIELADSGRWNNRAEALYATITETRAGEYSPTSIMMTGHNSTLADIPPLIPTDPQLLLPDQLIRPEQVSPEDIAPPEWSRTDEKNL